MIILINTNTVWDSPPRARHQLAEALADLDYQVYFVSGNQTGIPNLKTIPVKENLFAIIPSFPIPRRIRYRTPLVNEIYQKWLYKKLSKKFNTKDVLVICTDFGGYLITDFFRNTIYYASDDYINNVQLPGFFKRYTEFTQNKLLSNTRIAIATAQTLAGNFSKINPKSHYVPLGSPTLSSDLPVSSLKDKGEEFIHVVLLGYIDKKKTPIKLLKKILTINNKIKLHIIGPIKDGFLDDLGFKERIITLGTLTGPLLFKSLSEMDVAIAPYNLDDPNTARTPNKLWQYLSVGLPTVVTNLPSISDWEFPNGTVYKATDDDEFTDYVYKAYNENSDLLIKKRIQIAFENSWTKRASKIMELAKES